MILHVHVCSRVQCICTVQHTMYMYVNRAILYYAILYYTILYYTILYYTIVCYTILHSSAGYITQADLKVCGWARPRAVMATSLISPSQRMSGTVRWYRSRALTCTPGTRPTLPSGTELREGVRGQRSRVKTQVKRLKMIGQGSESRVMG